MEAQKTLENQINHVQKEYFQRYRVACFQVILQSHSKKNICGTSTKNGHMDQYDRIEDLDINSHSCNHLIFF